jgi:hypothetical protein
MSLFLTPIFTFSSRAHTQGARGADDFTQGCAWSGKPLEYVKFKETRGAPENPEIVKFEKFK